MCGKGQGGNTNRSWQEYIAVRMLGTHVCKRINVGKSIVGILGRSEFWATVPIIERRSNVGYIRDEINRIITRIK